MRTSPALLLLLAAPGVSQTTSQPSPKIEHALRERVTEFYNMQVGRKLRESEKLIAPDSRDDYFAGEKPEILDFKIQAIQWTKGFTQANVTMVSKVHTRHAMAGDEINSVPYASHWELLKGKWYWFIPKVTDRETAFGSMHVDQKEIEKHRLDLKKMIASGPSAQDLTHAVKLDRKEVVLHSEDKAGQVVRITNTVSGPVTLEMVVPPNRGYTVTLSKKHLGPNEEASLTVAPGPGIAEEGSIGIIVSPFNQNLTIQVRFSK